MAELRADFPAEQEGETEQPRAQPQPRREAAPPPEPVVAVTAPSREPEVHQEPQVVATPLAHTPQVIASFAPPPATYQAVSQHDGATEEAHRPVRRRKPASEQPAAPEPLQLVETAGEKVATVAVFEDEVANRRPVRRRRSAANVAAAEPLQLVETAPGAAVTDLPPQA
jgi:hypothetical protein